MKPLHALLPPLLRLAPDAVHAQFLAFAINRSLQGQEIARRLTELDGKRFCLHVEDVPLILTFQITTDGLLPARGAPHVTLRGSLREFAALALRREDPDTLFFQRRLAVEGETETGLHLKNLLDGWEYDLPAHIRAVLPPALAETALKAVEAARSLRWLSRLRRPGSRCNIHRAGMRAETQRRHSRRAPVETH